jgi:hypothetical protein
MPDRRTFAIYLVTFAIIISATIGQQCTDDTQARITACLDQVERDESQLPGGPCSSSDWRCICTKQQGMADCYSACPSLIPYDAANFDKKNCAGQREGVTMQDLGGSLMYTWSDLRIPLQGETIVSDNMSSVASSSAATQESGTTGSTQASTHGNSPLVTSVIPSATQAVTSSTRNGASVRNRFDALSLLLSCMLGNLAICMLS